MRSVYSRLDHYGEFYRTQGRPTLKKIDVYVIRWARRKFKRLRRKDCQIFRIIAVEHDKVRNEFDAYCLVQH